MKSFIKNIGIGVGLVAMQSAQATTNLQRISFKPSREEVINIQKQLDKALTMIATRDSEIEKLQGLLPPPYNTLNIVVNRINQNLEQKLIQKDTDLCLMITAFLNSWVDYNINSVNIKSISVLNFLKAWLQEALNASVKLEESP